MNCISGILDSFKNSKLNGPQYHFERLQRISTGTLRVCTSMALNEFSVGMLADIHEHFEI